LSCVSPRPLHAALPISLRSRLMGMRAPRVPPDQLPPVSPRLMLRDLGATLGLVWEANRLQTVLIATLSVVQALLPAATLWVAKQIGRAHVELQSRENLV